jgi:uncharacterized protein (DUF736 family)
MPEYDNNLTGALFPNDRKGDNDRAPDFTGSAEVEGVEYRMAGWKRVSRAGKAFISIKFEDKAEFDARQRERLEDAEGADALEL